MDELIKRLTETANIGEDVAKQVVEVVSTFMKDKLPAGIGDQVSGVLSGSLDSVGGLAEKAGDIAKGLGDIIGGEK